MIEFLGFIEVHEITRERRISRRAISISKIVSVIEMRDKTFIQLGEGRRKHFGVTVTESYGEVKLKIYFASGEKGIHMEPSGQTRSYIRKSTDF